MCKEGKEEMKRGVIYKKGPSKTRMCKGYYLLFSSSALLIFCIYACERYRPWRKLNPSLSLYIAKKIVTVTVAVSSFLTFLILFIHLECLNIIITLCLCTYPMFQAVQGPKLDYSHFISLPLAIHPNLVSELKQFKNENSGNICEPE